LPLYRRRGGSVCTAAVEYWSVGGIRGHVIEYACSSHQYPSIPSLRLPRALRRRVNPTLSAPTDQNSEYRISKSLRAWRLSLRAGGPSLRARSSHEPEAETNLNLQCPMGQTRNPPFGPLLCPPLTPRLDRSPRFGTWSLGGTGLFRDSCFGFRISRPRCGLGAARGRYPLPPLQRGAK
jgi:hypothetical protein